jgi:hypothetical protein
MPTFTFGSIADYGKTYSFLEVQESCKKGNNTRLDSYDARYLKRYQGIIKRDLYASSK